MGRLRRHLFGLSLEEASFARRGFHAANEEARHRLERAGRTFLQGYHAALSDARPAPLAATLDALPLAMRGFAYEGAAMGLQLQDLLLTGRRLQAFLEGPGAAHVYMVHVGAGWAMARLGRVRRPLRRLDPLLRWLALDGYGFHEGYFYPERTVRQQQQPRRLTGYAQRAFDQGLGRSLWFVAGANVARIAEAVATFPAARQADLWSGVGLACAYAGGAGPKHMAWLAAHSGAFRTMLAQGAAFAAEARRRAGNPAPHTSRACEILCGTSADDAAEATQNALHDLPAGSETQPAYEIWRQRIQARYSQAAPTRSLDTSLPRISVG